LLIAHHHQEKEDILFTSPLLLPQETSAICSGSNRILSGLLVCFN
jgi:hypothetical protein